MIRWVFGISVAEFLPYGMPAHPDPGDDHFAENGDQRVYALDYLSRIESAQFQARVVQLSDSREAELEQQHGLKSHHELFVASKSSHGSRRFPPPKVASGEDIDG